MNVNEIIHINGRYRKLDCDLIDNSHVMIRLKTGKDVRRVEVVYNDPYIRLNTEEGLYWPYHTVQMEVTGETYRIYYFSVTLPCTYHRLKYYFLIYDDCECIQYSESGFTKGRFVNLIDNSEMGREVQFGRLGFMLLKKLM